MHLISGFSPLAYRHLCGNAIWCFLMRRFWVLVSVFSSYFLPLQEDPQPPPPYPSSQLIRNSQHIVGPLCKRKSPWIIEAVSCRFSQSSVHCGKLINQAEALQKDFSKREAIVKSPVVDFSLFFPLKPVRCISRLDEIVRNSTPSNPIISWMGS